MEQKKGSYFCLVLCVHVSLVTLETLCFVYPRNDDLLNSITPVMQATEVCAFVHSYPEGCRRKDADNDIVLQTKVATSPAVASSLVLLGTHQHCVRYGGLNKWDGMCFETFLVS